MSPFSNYNPWDSINIFQYRICFYFRKNTWNSSYRIKYSIVPVSYWQLCFCVSQTESHQANFKILKTKSCWVLNNMRKVPDMLIYLFGQITDEEDQRNAQICRMVDLPRFGVAPNGLFLPHGLIPYQLQHILRSHGLWMTFLRQ